MLIENGTEHFARETSYRVKRARSKASPRFTCLDLFCGAGGLSEGFRQAGFQTVAANDYDAWAGATYEQNHGPHGTKFVLGDITAPAVKEALLQHVRGMEIDVVAGGPPCQAFSQVRNHKRIIDDPRNSLYRHFVQVLGLVRPRMFVMENVPGLENLAGGAVRKQIIEDLALDGEYLVESKVLDAAAFGVPQNRLRVVFVGVRRDLHTRPVFPSGLNGVELPRLDRVPGKRGFQYRHAKDVDSAKVLDRLLDATCVDLVTVRQAIGDLIHLRPNARLVRKPSNEAIEYESAPLSAYQRARRSNSKLLLNADVPSIREDTVTRLKAIPQGGNFRDLPEALSARYLNDQKWGPELGRENLSRKYFFAYRKLHPDHFSWTLNTKADCVYHYGTPRALTVREFARLHSFDDSYHFLHGDRHSRYRQVGNAVPPLLAKAIAQALIPVLSAHDQEQARCAIAAE
ncbi:DNA cytosine methyltransferase [Rhodopseudomonas parapalustris]